MTPPELSVESLTLRINQEIFVNAPIAETFAALLEQIGPWNETHEGTPLPMKIEPWPGGRWYRDLGDGNGHFWAHVQAIKRPTLLEFVGPLFASNPFASNVQYRLSETDGGTRIVFRHTGLGFVTDDQRAGASLGWASMLEKTRARAERAS